MRRQLLALLPIFLSATTTVAQTSKPVLVVKPDGFPSGHGSPEGVASDFARAFIKRDAGLYSDCIVKPFGGTENQRRVKAFLAAMEKNLNQEHQKKVPSPNGPKTILDVFGARHLTKSGPVSYAQRVYGFKDVMFVDIQAQLRNGKRATNRTFVIQAADGKWYVHPVPTAIPLLSDGLNNETPSTKDIAATYRLKR
jgi:hypothetical protein